MGAFLFLELLENKVPAREVRNEEATQFTARAG